MVFNHSVRSEVNIRYFEPWERRVLVTDRAPRETGVEQLFSPGEIPRVSRRRFDAFGDRFVPRRRAQARAHGLARTEHVLPTTLTVIAREDPHVLAGQRIASNQARDYLPAYHYYVIQGRAHGGVKVSGEHETQGDKSPVLAFVIPWLSGLADIGWAYRCVTACAMRVGTQRTRAARRNGPDIVLRCRANIT